MKHRRPHVLIALLAAATLAASCSSRGGASATLGPADPGGQTSSPAPAAQSNPTTTTPEAAERIFRGSIGGRGIEARLRREGEQLTGSYSYDGIDESLTLKGRVEAGGRLALDEFDAAGRQTGKFTGEWREDEDEPAAMITGDWTRPDGSRSVYFTLSEQQVALRGARIVPKVVRDKRLGVDASYPQLSGGANPSFAQFNARVSAVVNQSINDYRGALAPGEKNRYHSVSYDVLLATDDLLSVELAEDTFTGGAYPNATFYALVYDLRAGREVRPDELFKPGADYKKLFCKYAAAAIERRNRADAKESGETPANGPPVSEEELSESFNTWALARRGFVVYFDLPHVVAAYDRVFVPYGAVKDALRPDGAAARLAAERF